jgi:multicomponent Na+:H+ antiporter subunit B
VSEAVVVALMASLVALAIASVVAADLLVAALALGGYGFVMALLWAAFGAVDVAFTEAVVGAGATTVFFLAALLRTSRHRSPLPGRLRWFALGASLLAGVALVAVTQGLAPFGDPGTPPGAHVSPRYLEQGLAETGTPNIVTAVLADYRGYDTLIETVVIFTGGLACWLLLRRDGS